VSITVGKNWLVTDEGQCIAVPTAPPVQKMPPTYRLYRFLTDLEDILARVSDDRSRLELICPLVRHLLENSEWLQTNFSLPDPDTGWSVVMLYDEPDFEITVQTVAWESGSVSPVHNHATWGVVAMLNGQEKNTCWQRVPTPEYPDQIMPVGQILLDPGDIISFLPDAIHQIEVVGDEPTISFNLYGKTNYDQRFEFDIDRMKAKIF
jgi:predicted metal-dependent enzyme (double-stranded beta helix superfamily)